MVLESTMICVDSSDYMRNGDFLPTRMAAQQDAVNLICHSKSRSNPENNVGVLTLAKTEVLVTLTSDSGRILTKLHQVQPEGQINLVSGIRIAHLVLKHRQGRNHKMRIVAFVGSPVQEDVKDLEKLAKKLKKEKVNIDIINFGEEKDNTEKLTAFVNTINGKEGTSSHLVTVPPGPVLSDALLSSPVIVGEDGQGAVPGMGGGFEFGVDPNEDPELALALRVSMEEQRARQEGDAGKAQQPSAMEVTPAPASAEANSEEALLEQAMAMSMQQESEEPTPSLPVNYSSMSEEEQIALAMQMSMAGGDESPAESPMETDEGATPAKQEQEEDYSEMMNDPAFLQNVLEGLPGVDPQSEAVRSAMGSLADSNKDNKKDSKDKADKK
ncbi:unnamed protein product [Owenia fusiformis]|uniref:26S proteasome non-ATPase regulatory subunit 4 n=1 Tax=Owenia fusiformis TaxID=6347 RepID=A0A8S4NSW7_OWEFU|nr:unnamed protein product [Owenia fusiformis]